MRFIYCACVICFILNDWSKIDVDKSIEYIKDSLVGYLFEERYKKIYTQFFKIKF